MRGQGSSRFRRLCCALAAATLLPSCSAQQNYSVAMPPLVLGNAMAAGITDGRSRFREIFCAVEKDHGGAFPNDRPCSEALHQLNFETPPSGKPVHLGPARVRMHFVIVPGIYGECAETMARPFQDAIKPMKRLGWNVQPLDISGRASSEANAEAIRHDLRQIRLAPGEKLVLLGYSKGMSDLIELLGNNPEQVIPPDSSIISITGAVNGTPLADANAALYTHVWRVPLPGCAPADGGGVASLTRLHRLNYLVQHPLPPAFHYYSLPAFTDAQHISSFLRSGYSALANTDPRNDGNMLFYDSILPSSTLLGYANSDHWALVLPFAIYAPDRARLFATHNDYPRVVLLE